MHSNGRSPIVVMGEHARVSKALRTLWQQWNSNHELFCRRAGEVEEGAVMFPSDASPSHSFSGNTNGDEVYETARAALLEALVSSEDIVQRLYDLRASIVANATQDIAAQKDSVIVSTTSYRRVSALLLTVDQELQHQQYTASMLSSPGVKLAKIQTLLTTLNARSVCFGKYGSMGLQLARC